MPIRRMLVAVAAAIALVTVTAAAAAPHASEARSPSWDPKQVLRYSDTRITGAISPVALDPIQMRVAGADFGWGQPIYSTLLRPTPSGKYVPELATSVKIVNPSTLDIRLRRGVVFSDGAPFNAQAVKAGLERTLATKNTAGVHQIFLTIASIEATGSHALRIRLKQPVAGAFYLRLADNESFIVSPKAAADPSIDLNKTPVGAGPFTLELYRPTERMVFKKNPRYWNAKAIKVAGFEIINVAPGPQQVNALRTNLTQLEYQLTPDLVSALRAANYPARAFDVDGSLLHMPMCKNLKPFDDARVRQALNYAIDRNTINRAVLNGKGAPMWSLWPKGDPLYVKELEGKYAYNPTKAKQLLTAAGYPSGFKTTMTFLPGNPVGQQVAQVIQDQWKRVGIDVDIVQTANFTQDFYVRNVTPIAVVSTIRPGLDKINGPLGPGSIGNKCQYDDPKLNAIMAKINALAPDSPEAVKTWQQAQRYIYDNALHTFINWVPFEAAWHPRLRGVEFLDRARPVPDLWSVWFARR